MRVQDEEFKTMIYDLMNGHYDLDKFDCEESSVVENEFEEGRYCEKLYSEMLAAYGRICQRLHEQSGEDKGRGNHNKQSAGHGQIPEHEDV